MAVSPLSGALDDHNPIGVSGIFEGMITTGCAYNVVSHNARREIDDIVVPGAIGKYGLKMTRYYNSRRTSSYLLMGPGWSHEYLWTGSISDRIDYPNGNVWDNHCMGDWGFRGPLGVSDGPTNWNGYPAFRLADGGWVVFETGNVGVATKIVDPHGQITSITLVGTRITQVTEPGGRYLKFLYENELLTKVEAHGLGNATVTDWVVYHYTSVAPGNGHPPLMCLSSVDYKDNQHAYYYYDPDNSPNNTYPPCPCPVSAFPVLRGCDDVRYRGPMRTIAYKYPDVTAHEPHGAIVKEKYWDGDPQHLDQGAMVSSIDPLPPSALEPFPAFERTYTETRGDGPTRTFTYTPLHLGRPANEDVCPTWNSLSDPAPQQFLQSYTDFSTPSNSTQLGYDSNWYINSVTDANSHTTNYDRGPPPDAYLGTKGIGEITKISYHDGAYIVYDYQPEDDIGGHYLTSTSQFTRDNTRRNQTIHTRDNTTHKITLTNYMDGTGTSLARETFTYCDQTDSQCGPVNPTTGKMHGQIKTQQLKNRAYVHYKYDSSGRGLLVAKTEPTWVADPTTALNGPKTTYTYYPDGETAKNPWADRIKTVTGPAPNWPYSSQASETYEYDRALTGNRGHYRPKWYPGRGAGSGYQNNACRRGVSAVQIRRLRKKGMGRQRAGQHYQYQLYLRRV